MNFKNIKDEFLSRYSMNSELTKKKYSEELNTLFGIIQQIQTLEDYNSLDYKYLNKFYDYSKTKNWANSTTNHCLLLAKNFGKWMVKKGYSQYNIFEDVKLIRCDNEVRFTPSELDCAKLLNFINKHTKKKRLYIMANLLLNSGLRRMEICNLKIKDINVHNNTLSILGKGNKMIEHPIPNSVINEITNYINIERKEVMDKYIKLGGIDKGYVFLSGIGEKVNSKTKNLTNGNKINEVSFYNQIKKYAKLAGLENNEKISTHALRRRYVTSIYEKTSDILVAQKAARHSSSTTTTKCYINFDVNRLKNAVENLYNNTDMKFETLQSIKETDKINQPFASLNKKYV